MDREREGEGKSGTSCESSVDTHTDTQTHRHTHTTMCKTDSSVPCDDLEGWEVGVGRETPDEGVYVYI